MKYNSFFCYWLSNTFSLTFFVEYICENCISIICFLVYTADPLKQSVYSTIGPLVFACDIIAYIHTYLRKVKYLKILGVSEDSFWGHWRPEGVKMHILCAREDPDRRRLEAGNFGFRQ